MGSLSSVAAFEIGLGSNPSSLTTKANGVIQMMASWISATCKPVEQT